MVTAWRLEIAMPTEPAVPEPPAGITVRSFQPGDEGAAYQLTEDAFDEWQERRKSYQEWARLTVERATFAPSLRTCTLWTHSDTGALSLYERLGMTVRHSSTVYRKALDTDH
jgi:hypothetical protein